MRLPTARRKLPPLLERLLGYPDVRGALQVSPPEASGPVLPLHFVKNGRSLRLFTTITTLGTPQDIAVQELRIECFFPMDDETAEAFRGWASS